MDTIYGRFEVSVFEQSPRSADIVLLHRSSLTAHVSLIRVQAHCLTSTAFRSTMCDCAAQIHGALTILQNAPFGILVYLDQEGRNYGLGAKVELMRLMNAGRTLGEARHQLGRTRSLLDFSSVPTMLSQVGVTGPVDLLTNSSYKAEALAGAGLEIRHRVPIPPSGLRT
jgi:GTP cyclohydrolase II